MSDVTYKLFGLVAAGTSTDSAATIDIQDDGFIEGVLLGLNATGADALNDGARVEVGFGSTNTYTTNDVRSSIAMLHHRQGFLTSGGGPVGQAIYLAFQKGIPVSAGERIHMHLESFGGTADAFCYLYVVTSRGVARRATRRRR